MKSKSFSYVRGKTGLLILFYDDRVSVTLTTEGCGVSANWKFKTVAELASFAERSKNFFGEVCKSARALKEKKGLR